MTTFVSREVARDALAALLVAKGSWQTVYAYEPQDIKGHSPVATIRSLGTSYSNTFNISPTSFDVLVTNWVLLSDSEDPSAWGPAQAEDQLDALDKALREVVKDGAPGTGLVYVEFKDRPSAADATMISGLLYRIEDFYLEVGVNA